MHDSDFERLGFTIIQGEKPIVTYANTMRRTLKNLVDTFSNERTLNIYISWLQGKTMSRIAREEGITRQSVLYHMGKIKRVFPNMKPWI